MKNAREDNFYIFSFSLFSLLHVKCTRNEIDPHSNRLLFATLLLAIEFTACVSFSSSSLLSWWFIQVETRNSSSYLPLKTEMSPRTEVNCSEGEKYMRKDEKLFAQVKYLRISVQTFTDAYICVVNCYLATFTPLNSNHIDCYSLDRFFFFPSLST